MYRKSETLAQATVPTTTAGRIVLDSRAFRPTGGWHKILQVSYDYIVLTKPEINFLIAITTAAGFWAASARGHVLWRPLFHASVGTVLGASGAAALNQVIEKPYDALMRRTQNRPLVAGRIRESSASYFGWLTALVGLIYLVVLTRPLASLLAAISLFGYLFVYTPLKRKSHLAIFVGAIFGAIPPLIGWSAVHGGLKSGAWMLFAVIFLRQIPHFSAIAFMYREDYIRAGYKIVPSEKHSRELRGRETLFASAMLIPVGMIPTFAASKVLFSILTLLLSMVFLLLTSVFVFTPSRLMARRLLTASIIYLPLLLIVIVVAKA